MDIENISVYSEMRNKVGMEVQEREGPRSKFVIYSCEVRDMYVAHI